MEDLKVVVNGVGAAGVACSKIVMNAGVSNLIGCDQHGAIYAGREEHMNWVKDHFSRISNPNGERGNIHDIIKGADVFFGLSVPGVIDVEDVKRMAPDPIIFAMANPTPEIMPEEVAGVAAVMATGRSDYPNQINNVLCFPGIFRGALDVRAREITEEMKMAAARGIAAIVADEELREDYIIPSVFNRDVADSVAAAVAEQAKAQGAAEAREGELGYAAQDTEEMRAAR
jgi:malate dehydrogenase (oxaloacetate-decarboxylating)